jgi:hypothetical protein
MFLLCSIQSVTLRQCATPHGSSSLASALTFVLRNQGRKRVHKARRVMKPIDDTGHELDAIFSVQPTSDGAYLILDSRGGPSGGRPPRNPDYGKALELLLHRLGQESAVLTGVEVYSRETIPRPVEERRIAPPDFPLPLALASLSDAERERFRNELGSASAAIGRSPERTSGGNPTKRLRLALEWADAIGRNGKDLEARLARALATLAEKPLPRLEQPTSDPDELESARVALNALYRLWGTRLRLHPHQVSRSLKWRLQNDSCVTPMLSLGSCTRLAAFAKSAVCLRRLRTSTVSHSSRFITCGL